MINLNSIYNEDCLEGMKRIPDGSIDMILCDLPYGTVKGLSLNGWRNASTNWDNIIEQEELFDHYSRILRENGVAILFSQEPYTSKLRSFNQNKLTFAYPLIWEKDHFANPFNAKKAPVSYFEDINVFYKKYDTELLNPLRKYFSDLMIWIGFDSCKQINKVLGHRKAEHSFYINSTQFKLCTKSVYEELINELGIRKFPNFKEYKELLEINESYGRTFNLQEDKSHMSNILKFKKDYQGLHPTQKPVALFEHLIKTYTNCGDTVLDNCMGSGTTAIACMNTGRNFIGFETDATYYQQSLDRIGKQLELD